MKVQKGDVIAHLRETSVRIEFIGYWYSKADSYTTNSTPFNQAHKWNFLNSFLKLTL